MSRRGDVVWGLTLVFRAEVKSGSCSKRRGGIILLLCGWAIDDDDIMWVVLHLAELCDFEWTQTKRLFDCLCLSG